MAFGEKGIRVLVTGAGGGLGRKLIAHLLETDWCAGVSAVDLVPPTDIGDSRVQLVAADLLDRSGAWVAAMAECDAVVHFAAQNPHTDASWADAAASMDMTLSVFDAAAAAGVQRVVFASSNHVMGGYKDEPLAQPDAGFLTTDLPPGVGTRWETGGGWMDSTPYATAKLAGERALVAVAARTPALTGVAVRIGWVLPEENRPEGISLSGDVAFTAASEPEDAEGRRDLKWYRNMWLSNRDFAALFEAAIRAPAEGWPARSITVNGTSDNRGMGWDLTTARQLLGYRPSDDLYAALGM